jgi:hypothetical protein
VLVVTAGVALWNVGVTYLVGLICITPRAGIIKLN